MLSVSSETENASEMPNLPASGEPTGMPQGSGAPHAGHGGEAGTAPTGKTLVIAEKRSVGRTLAAFLGCHADRGGWIEGERCDVTWAQGHLLRMLMPDEYEEHPEWRERDVHALPIVPDADGWRWRVSAERGADAQYAVLAQLVGSGRYARVVNACDPDREGQCIADLALQFMGCTLPVERLWCSSLEDAALAKAFGRMKPNAAYAGLYQSAIARSKADWLVGMNASRLYSASLRSAQSVGRVRTPTLALVVERDRQIEAFKVSESFRVRLDLGEGFVVTGEPMRDGAAAKRILAEAQGAPCQIVEVERKRAREGAPTLLNTTGAQKLASERLGMSPDAVDRVLQSLYEKKLATYPRTDSRFVNAEDGEGLEALISAVADEAHVGAHMAKTFAALGHDVGKVVDDAKVEGHGALLPTRQLTAEKLAALPEDEAAVARLLCEALLTAVAPDRIYDRVAVKATCRELPYTASAVTDVDRGWKRLRPGAQANGGGGASDDDASAEGASADKCRIPADLEAPCAKTVLGGEVRSVKARPPKRYTDATLLAAMEHADRFVEADELKVAIRDSSLHSGGIGTPATRAGIIASLVDRGYLLRKGSTLTSTPEGRVLVDEVDDSLKSVELTARMERDLTAIAKDEAQPEPFVAGVVAMVRQIVANQLARPPRTAAPKGPVLGSCPVCGAPVVDTGNERAPYLCTSTRRERIEQPDGSVVWRDCGRCTFRLSRTFMGAPVTPVAAKRLLAGKPVMIKGLMRRDGTKVDRLVALDESRGWGLWICEDQSVKVGACPKCGGRVLDVGNDRVPLLCENNRRGAAGESQSASCDFRLFREYLGKRFTKGEIGALLAGKTVTVKGLTSHKTGNLFDANLMLDPERDFRVRIVGYPEQSEQTLRANERAAQRRAKEEERRQREEQRRERERQRAEKAAAEARARESQGTLPGLEW